MDNVPAFMLEVQRRLSAGLIAAAQVGAEKYIEAVSRVQEEPDDNLNFPGPHSEEGEFPNYETGQGAANIEWVFDEANLQSAFGVRGPDTGYDLTGDGYRGGLHLYFLSHGVHPITGIPFGRLGMDDIFFFYQPEIRDAFIRAAA